LIKLLKPLLFFIYWNRFYKGDDSTKKSMIDTMAIIASWTYNRNKYWWMPEIKAKIKEQSCKQ